MGIQRDARFDATRTYRYVLSRTWDTGAPRVTFVMLNPSRADEQVDDPTIRRCMSYARREGGGGLDVVNLFAFCTPHPVELAVARDPVGPENDRHLADAIEASRTVIVAWGDGAPAQQFQRVLDSRVAHVGERLAALGAVCFGTTRRGHPRHPVRLAKDRALEPWTPELATQ